MVQVFVRRQGGDGARYGFHYNFEAGKGQWEIKFDGVVSAKTRILATNASFAPPEKEGTLRIEATENSISGFYKCPTCQSFSLVLTAADKDPQAILRSGQPGLVSRERVDIPLQIKYPTAVFASWSGGNL